MVTSEQVNDCGPPPPRNIVYDSVLVVIVEYR